MRKLAVWAYNVDVPRRTQPRTIESAGEFRPVRPEDDKRSASDDQQVTKRSAESVPPEPRGLRGRGGERPFSKRESARSAANWWERGSEMNPEDFRRSKCGQIRGTPKYASRRFGCLEKGHLPFEKRHLISCGARALLWR
jgi:hypothetical protein